MSQSSEPTRPRQRHLMDPEVLRRNYERAEAARQQALREGRTLDTTGETVYLTDRPDDGRKHMPIEQVRRIIIVALTVVTCFHLCVGLALAGILSGDRGAAIGLNAAAVLTGVFAVVSSLLVFRRPWLSWWLLLGPVPGLVGLWFSFR
ncbi:hypothetical protein D9V37_09960 [Nocardioides mangrovicus]|uniref:Uncharacterized protein n=1 Tax=Nocardioides mangrovicus TaxID=2478913 RepID=A0A3L8P255_9ACTN|nr:hypothetical protein [Nocardioides mangrovicus]RLV48913.1 hypothetical protein D9V37_09960 [Nocardioides mangrovicus]